MSSASPLTPGANETLDDRYGTGRRRRFDRRFAWGAGIALVLAGVAFLLLSGWQQGNLVRVQDIGFEKRGELAADVKFTVSGPPGARMACAVEALSTSKATVGWNVIEIPVSASGDHTVTTRLLTTGPLTAASARECWILE